MVAMEVAGHAGGSEAVWCLCSSQSVAVNGRCWPALDKSGAVADAGTGAVVGPVSGAAGAAEVSASVG